MEEMKRRKQEEKEEQERLDNLRDNVGLLGKRSKSEADAESVLDIESDYGFKRPRAEVVEDEETAFFKICGKAYPNADLAEFRMTVNEAQDEKSVSPWIVDSIKD